MTRALLFITLLGVGLVLEKIRPLRKATQSKRDRWIRNLFIAAFSALLIRFTAAPWVLSLSEWTADQRRGLLPFLEGQFGWLTPGFALVLSFFLQDYVIYVWHVANHRNTFLWRFHNVHHVDLDMDVSTATRFHFGELFLSAVLQCAVVALLGISPKNFLIYQATLVTATQFHHSNLRLPDFMERVLRLMIITPKMHEVHHAAVLSETDSNWGTVFSFWDRLHHTFHEDVSSPDVRIGVPAYRDPAELTLPRLLAMPLKTPRPWPVEKSISEKAQ
ncbi:MAG: sterol desaturase family protein [Methylotenera sp.]|nr:sterol desaturase family protein [Oligoflexia bacterium]